ncbi:MAG TPA: hypothetical protein ENH15_03460 [Actinobacteria bacterium]|nr:hypothetical protein [Actinomycetota bacterium]
MSRLLLLANPSASAFTGGLHRDIVTILSESHTVEPAWPRDPAESQSMATAASGGDFNTVVAMGGDGVVHHVANGLAGTGVTLGIIPAGTTNVVARLLGIASKPKQAAADLVRVSNPTEVPLTRLSTTGIDGVVKSRYSTFAAGVGMDADVVAVADRDPSKKSRFGSLHYARSAAGVVLNEYRSKEPDLCVTIEGERHHGVAVLVQLHHKYTYFGRVPLAVGNHEPGTLSVLVIERLPLKAVPRILVAASLGADLNKVAGCFAATNVSSVEIEAGEGALAQADGEALGQVRSLVASVQTDLLRVALRPSH